MEQIRIIIVDDFALIAGGVKKLVEAQNEMLVVDSVASAELLFKSSSLPMVDLILMDINLPGMNGILATEKLLKLFPNIKVIALSMYDDSGYVNKMVQAGASGYLLKTVDAEELILAIKKVFQGKTYFSSELMHEKKKPSKIASSINIILTSRETEILTFIVQGFSNQVISEKLSISLRTVEKHRSHIMEKTASTTVPGLIRYAFSKGIL